MPIAAGAQTSMLEWAFSNGTPSPARPTAWYASLHTASPPTTGNELTGSGYARQSVGSLTVSGSAASNSGAVTFGAFTGSISGITTSGLWDASTSGNLWGYSALVQLGATYGAVAAGIVNGGTGYSVGNTLTCAGGAGTEPTLMVTAVNSGVITGVTVLTPGALTSLPTSQPVSVTGGGGSGATFDMFYSQTTSTYNVNNGDSLTFGIGELSYSLGGVLNFSPS